MKHISIILALLMMLCSPVAAQDFDKGLAAAQAGDFATAFKEWLPLAEAGDVNAQFRLGIMYDNGDGVTQNHKEAVKWYKLAAEQGHPNSQFNVGLRYENGQGVNQDYQTAIKWYKLAAEKRNPRAEDALGSFYKLGHGVTQNYQEAIKWYKLSSEQGYSRAQHNMALMYYDGLGVTKDYQEAAKWYKLAAEQGYPKAQEALGVLYVRAEGVTQDYAMAYLWFSIGADNGNKKSLQYRDMIAKEMTPAAVTKAQAMARVCMDSNYEKCGYEIQPSGASKPLTTTPMAKPSNPEFSQKIEASSFSAEVSKCWVVALGSPESKVAVTVGFQLKADGKVNKGSIRLLEHNSKNSSVAKIAFQAARRAILRCQKGGYNIPEGFDTSTQLILKFNPETMR